MLVYVQKVVLLHALCLREVVQSGGIPALGAGGRRFESCLPDNIVKNQYYAT